MLDSDLAYLYDVDTKVLNQAVKRNIERFPLTYMFQLSGEEWNFLKSQIVTSKEGRGGKQKLPYVFNEHGVLMLSSVLNSKKAIAVSIQIIEIFVKLRQLATTPVQEVSELKKLLLLYIENTDHKLEEQDNKIAEIIHVLNHLLEEPRKTEQIGFRTGN